MDTIKNSMTPEILALNHVALLVADLEKSGWFYREVIGLQEIPRPVFGFPGTWFRIGTGQELHLIAGRTHEVFSGHRAIHFALEAKDPGKATAHFEKMKVNFRPAKARPDGAVQIFVEDPDGYWVELAFFSPESSATGLTS